MRYSRKVATRNVVIALLGILVVAMAAGVYFMSVGEGQTVIKVSEAGQQLATCDSSTTPDLDINAYDAENPGTALTEGTNLYRKVGNKAWTAFTQGTAITTMEVGQEYEFVLGISTSDFTDNAYGPYLKHTIQCQELESMDIAVYNDEIETELTATFYNTNHDASAQAFTAGQVKNVYAKWSAGSDQVCGNPFIKDSGLGDIGKHSAQNPNVLCLNLNKTVWDTPDSIKVNGVDMDLVGAPIRHSTDSGDSAFCYEAPVIDDADVEFVLRLDADDTTAPADDGTAYLYCGNFYIGKDGELAWGVETAEGVAVGTDASDSLTLDFTA